MAFYREAGWPRSAYHAATPFIPVDTIRCVSVVLAPLHAIATMLKLITFNDAKGGY